MAYRESGAASTPRVAARADTVESSTPRSSHPNKCIPVELGVTSHPVAQLPPDLIHQDFLTGRVEATHPAHVPGEMPARHEVGEDDLIHRGRLAVRDCPRGPEHMHQLRRDDQVAETDAPGRASC